MHPLCLGIAVHAFPLGFCAHGGDETRGKLDTVAFLTSVVTVGEA